MHSSSEACYNNVGLQDLLDFSLPNSSGSQPSSEGTAVLLPEDDASANVGGATSVLADPSFTRTESAGQSLDPLRLVSLHIHE